MNVARELSAVQLSCPQVAKHWDGLTEGLWGFGGKGWPGFIYLPV